MKTLITVITVLILNQVCLSQNTYLKITRSSETNDYVMYPPGTEFELKNEHGYIIMKYSETPRTVRVEGNYELTVFPSWKKKADVFKLTEGAVELVLTENHNPKPYRYNISIDEDNITAHVKVSDSEMKLGQKNLYFELSNGINFTYRDGKYFAKLKDNYLDVKYKYIIESDLGTLKLSFNTKTGKVWWVFE